MDFVGISLLLKEKRSRKISRVLKEALVSHAHAPLGWKFEFSLSCGIFFLSHFETKLHQEQEMGKKN